MIINGTRIFLMELKETELNKTNCNELELELIEWN